MKWITLALVLVGASIATAQAPVCLQAYDLFRQHFWSEAANTFQQCETSNPGKTDALLYRGKALVNLDDFDGAQSSLNAYVAVKPQSDDALYLLGYVEFRRNHPKESLATFARASKIRSPQAGDLKIAGLDYVLLNDYENAARYLEESLRVNPDDLEARYHLGRVRYQQNKFDLAIAAFKEVLLRDPANLKAEDNLGLCLEAKNDTEAAIAAYRKAIQLDESSIARSEQPYLNLGKLLITLNRTPEAASALMKAVAIKPDSAPAHYELGRAEFTTGNLEEARIQVQETIQLDPQNSSPHYLLGRILKKMGKNDEAEKEFRLTEELVQQHNSQSGGMAAKEKE